MKKPVEKIYTKILINTETHYIHKDGKTYCGIEIPNGMIGSSTIDIITCNKCVNICLNSG